MSKYQAFYNTLTALLAAYPDIAWRSGHTSPITPVMLPFWRTLRWKGQADKQAEIELAQQVEHARSDEYSDEAAMLKLAELFRGRVLVSYLRKRGRELYILVPFGWWKVGFVVEIKELG